VFIQLSFSFLRRDGGIVYVIRLLFACGISFSFFFFLRTTLLVCLHRRKEKGSHRERGAGVFGTWFIYATAQMLSPLGFCFWLCSTGGGESVPDVRWTRCQNKTAGTSPFLLCCPVSASRLFSSCRVGFAEGRMTA
jgi:hypothetical protein